MTGKSVLSQLAECLILRYGFGRISRDAYYDLRLFDDDGLTLADKKCFVGYGQNRVINDVLNDVASKIFADDKLVFYATCLSLGIAVPKLHVVYDAGERNAGNVPVLQSRAALADYLRAKMSYPFFAKPSAGSWGEGSASIQSFDDRTDELVMLHGDRCNVEDYVARVVANDGAVIFQETLRPHAEIERRCGIAVATARLMLLRNGDDLTLLHAVWRIPVARNWTDNFRMGQTGNLVALIEIETGRITRVVDGSGFDQREIEFHPTTGERLLDFQLPDWLEVRGLARSVADAFPGYRLHHLDIAMTNRGPVMLELNYDGSLVLHERASHRGIFHGALRDAFLQAKRNAP